MTIYKYKVDIKAQFLREGKLVEKDVHIGYDGDGFDPAEIKYRLSTMSGNDEYRKPDFIGFKTEIVRVFTTTEEFK